VAVPNNRTARFLPLVAALAFIVTLFGACSKQAPVTCAGGDITANPWQLKSYGPSASLQSPANGTLMTLSFLSGGTAIAGSDGCSAYFGRSQINKKTCGLKIDQSITTTKNTCETAVAAQEQKYLDLLKAAQRYTISADGLHIVCGKEELNFVPYVEKQ